MCCDVRQVIERHFGIEEVKGQALKVISDVVINKVSMYVTSVLHQRLEYCVLGQESVVVVVVHASVCGTLVVCESLNGGTTDRQR